MSWYICALLGAATIGLIMLVVWITASHEEHLKKLITATVIITVWISFMIMFHTLIFG